MIIKKNVKTILCLFILIQCSISLKSQNSSDTCQHLQKLTLLNHKKVMKGLFGEPNIKVKTLGILVYDGFSAMDGIAPMVVFSELMNVKVHYIGLKKGTIKSDLLDINIDKTIDDIKQLDVLLVPGGNETAISDLMKNTQLTNWLQKIDANSIMMAGVGSGVFILGNANLLNNKNATTNWYHAQQNLQKFQANYQDVRYLNDGKYWTSVGSTASIDMCLKMVQQISGDKYLQGAMLDLEYDPKPPLEAGTVQKTEQKIIELVSNNSKTINGIDYLTKISDSDLQNAFGTNSKVDSIGILVYDGTFTLDFLGPLTVLSQLPKTKVFLIGTKKGNIKSGRTNFNVNYSIREINSLDVLLIPGGSIGTWNTAQDSSVRRWIKHIDRHTKYTTSVCTGAWILGEAGLLKNRKATTHWYHKNEMLAKYGAMSINERYTKDEKYWTSAGVSAGIDLSYAMIKDLEGELFLQYALLNLNYNPQSPIKGGTPANSDPKVVDMMTQMYDYMMLKKLNITPSKK